MHRRSAGAAGSAGTAISWRTERDEGFGSVLKHIASVRLREWAGFAFLCAVSLAAMSYVYAMHAAQASPAARGIAYAGERFGQLTAIDAGQTFIMDGGIDQWVYVLFRNGLTSIPYESIPVQEKGVLYLYSAVMVLLGKFDTYYLVLVNWMAHVVAALLLYAVVSRTYDRQAGLLAGGLFLVFPENLYWGGTLYKDGLVVMLVLAAIYALLRVSDGRRLHFLTLSLALYGIAFFRSGQLLAVMLAGAVALACGGRRSIRRLAEYAAVIMVSAGVFALVFPSPVTAEIQNRAFGRVYGKLIHGSTYTLDAHNITYRTTKQESLIERVGGGDLDINKLHYVPLRVAAYMIAPFPPWQTRFAGDNYIIPTTWAIVSLLSFFAVGFFRGISGGFGPAMTLCIFFLCLGIVIVFAGPFIYERYRLLITPLYLAISSSVLMSSPWRTRALLFLGSVAFMAAVFLLWSLLKSQT